MLAEHRDTVSASQGFFKNLQIKSNHLKFLSNPDETQDPEGSKESRDQGAECRNAGRRKRDERFAPALNMVPPTMQVSTLGPG